jgi:hypothetical protein
MTRRDRRLQRVRPAGVTQRLGALERGQTAMDEQLIPPRAILLEQQHRLPFGGDPRRGARRLDLHQRDQAVHLRLLRHQLGEDAPEAERVLAQGGTKPFVSGSCGISLIEHQINGLEHRPEPRLELRTARHLERHTGLGQRALGADDPLRHRRLGDEEGARDLVRREPAEQPKRQRDARIGGEHRVARREHQPEQVVADVSSSAASRSGTAPPAALELVAELLVLALEHAPPRTVDRPVLGRRHEPRAGIVGTPDCRPALERAQQRVLREVLREPDVAHDAREPAISFADSIRQTVSITRCVSATVTAFDSIHQSSLEAAAASRARFRFKILDGPRRTSDPAAPHVISTYHDV